MASQEVSYSIDDKDLDDATLWALMDSASTSSLSSKPHKSHQPPTPVSHHSSPVLSFATRPAHRAAQHSPREDSRLLRDGEVVQEPRAKAYEPLPKIARMTYSPGVGETSPLQLVMRSAQRSPATAVKFSPEISLLGISSPGNNVQSEEREAMRHGLSGRFPTVSLFKEYQNAAMAILEKTDYTMISGHPFIKKSGWRKISCYFNLSYEIRDKTIEFDENRDVQRAEFIVRACMQGGRFSDGWGSCDRREKRFSKPNHDIPSTAETRAKNKACQDLLGVGEYCPGANRAC